MTDTKADTIGYTKLVKYNFNTCTYRGNGFISIIKYNYNGELLFIGDKDSNLISVIDTNNKKIIGNYEGHTGVIWCIDICKNDLLVSGSGDMCVILWDLKLGKQIKKIKYKGIPKNVAISNDGKWLLVSVDTITKRSRNLLYLYNLDNLISNTEGTLSDNTETRLIMEPESKITSINWLQSSVIILSYEDGNIEFVSITNSDDLQPVLINPLVINKYKLHDGAIKSISFNKDRTKIVSASIDKTSKIFDLEKREVELTITNNVPINSACFSPIKNVIMIGGGLDAMSVAFSSNNDLSIKFCSMRKGKPIGEINTHFGPIRHIEFNPNGKNFASSGQDGYVKIYSLCAEYVGNVELPKFDMNECVINMKLNNVSNNQLINEVIKYIDYNINTSTKPVKTDEKKSVGTYSVTNIASTPTPTLTLTPTTTVCDAEFTGAGSVGAYNLKKVFEKYSSNVVEGGIKISNLPNTMTRNDLEEMFELYGRIKERGIYIKNYNDDTIAYINYEDIESAKKAVSAMNGARYEYLVLHVELLLR